MKQAVLLLMLCVAALAVGQITQGELCTSIGSNGDLVRKPCVDDAQPQITFGIVPGGAGPEASKPTHRTLTEQEGWTIFGVVFVIAIATVITKVALFGMQNEREQQRQDHEQTMKYGFPEDRRCGTCGRPWEQIYTVTNDKTLREFRDSAGLEAE